MAGSGPEEEVPPKQPQETSSPRRVAWERAMMNTASIAETAAAERRTQREKTRNEPITHSASGMATAKKESEKSESIS